MLSSVELSRLFTEAQKAPTMSVACDVFRFHAYWMASRGEYTALDRLVQEFRLAIQPRLTGKPYRDHVRMLCQRLQQGVVSDDDDERRSQHVNQIHIAFCVIAQLCDPVMPPTAAAQHYGAFVPVGRPALRNGNAS
jgi:hypothetical protein